MTDIADEQLLKSKDIFAMLEKANVPISRATFDRWLKSGYFPQPAVVMGPRFRRWTERQIKDWLAKCVEDAKK